MEKYSDTNLDVQIGIPVSTIGVAEPPPVYKQPPQYAAPPAVYPPQTAPPPAAYPPPHYAVCADVHPPHLANSAAGNTQQRGVGNMWTTGLFDCSEDPENALLTCIAPCITFGQIAEVLDEGRTPCSTSGCIYCVSSFALILPLLLSTNLRARIRRSFNLMEEPAPDLFVHLCFEVCALCQEYRELKNRGFNPGLGWAGIQMARSNPGTMIPPQPMMMNQGGVV